MSNSHFNFYEILNASPTATIEELKSCYKQLILQCHPDKLQQQLEMKTNYLEIRNDDPNNLQFVAITEAWNCLKDPNKRKQYDAELLLNKFHTHNNIFAHIKFIEMKKQPNTGQYFGDYEEEGKELSLKKSGEGEEEKVEEVLKYIYTYDCRCGGQYILDESAEQFCRSGIKQHDTQIKSNDNNGVDDDDADNTTQNNNNKNSPNNGGGGVTVSGGAGGSEEGVVRNNRDEDNDVEEEGGELIVECSECSLVIILNG